MSAEFHIFAFIVIIVTAAGFSMAQQPPASPQQKQPALQSIPDAQYKMGGELGRRLEAVTEQWIIPAPQANPQMLEMFRTQNRKPLVRQFDGAVRPFPWIGEYAGKYLTHAVQTYKLTHDQKLIEHLKPFVAELVSLQADDGYLGPWPADMQFKQGTWDAWGHYHIMLGLLLWHEQTQDAAALACASKIGDMLCSRFLNTKVRITDTGSQEMNMAPIHSLCLLYEKTGEKRYLDLALEIEKEFPEAGDYVRAALAGREFFQTPRPRWESLHPIMGIAELYYITGDENYRKAFEQLWWSMDKCDRHNNGGFSSREAAHGDPYSPGAIETCCTVAWMALSVDMLRLTGDPRVADELELSMFNSGLGLMSYTGRWVTYDTPMDGIRYPSLQCGDPGGANLNCCSVNGPRAIAMTCEWALMRNGEELVLNYYGPCEMGASLPDGNYVTLTQETDYPIGNKINLTVSPQKSQQFTLALRIPAWSAKTSVSVNGEAVPAAAGEYLKLNRKWTAGDNVAIELDFTPHFWVHRQAMQPSPWNAKWTLFGPVEGFTDKQRKELDEQVAAATEIPKTMTYTTTDFEKNAAAEAGKTVGEQNTLKPITEQAKDGCVNLSRAIDDRDRPQIAYAFAEYDSPSDQKLRLTFAASAGVVLFVNGKGVPMPPNTDNPWHARNLSAEIPLHKGRNIIAMALPKERFFDVLWFWNTRWFLNAGWETPVPGNMVTSIYRGPILLTYDPRYNGEGVDELTVMNAKGLSPKLVDFNIAPRPWILCELKADDGKTVRLCDFASAGATGTLYMSWLRVHFDGETSNEFTRENPLRSFRPQENVKQ